MFVSQRVSDAGCQVVVSMCFEHFQILDVSLFVSERSSATGCQTFVSKLFEHVCTDWMSNVCSEVC